MGVIWGRNGRMVVMVGRRMGKSSGVKMERRMRKKTGVIVGRRVWLYSIFRKTRGLGVKVGGRKRRRIGVIVGNRIRKWTVAIVGRRVCLCKIGKLSIMEAKRERQSCDWGFRTGKVDDRNM